MNKIRSVLSQYMGQSRSVYVLFFGKLVTSMGALIWPMLALILSRKLGYSEAEVGVVMIIIGLIFLPATWIGGRIADRFDRKKIIIVFDTISVAAFITCAFIEPGTLMLVFFVLAGWFAHMESPVYESLIIDVTTPEEREMAFSLVYLGRNLGMIIGTALGGILFESYLNIAFIIDGVTTLSSTILVVLFVVYVKSSDLSESVKNEYEDEIDAGEKVMNVLKDRRSVFIQIGIFFFTGIIYDQLLFTIPLYMSELFGNNGAAYYGAISSFNGVLVIIMVPIITKLSERYTELPKIIMGISLFSISYLLISGKPFLILFFVFMFFFTIGEVLNMLGTSPFMSRRVPSTHRGRINSYVYIAYFLGNMAGKGIAGYMIQYVSYKAVFVSVSVVGAAVVLLTYYNYGVDKMRFPKLYEMKLDLKEELE